MSEIQDSIISDRILSNIEKLEIKREKLNNLPNYPLPLVALWVVVLVASFVIAFIRSQYIGSGSTLLPYYNVYLLYINAFSFTFLTFLFSLIIFKFYVRNLDSQLNAAYKSDFISPVLKEIIPHKKLFLFEANANARIKNMNIFPNEHIQKGFIHFACSGEHQDVNYAIAYLEAASNHYSNFKGFVVNVASKALTEEQKMRLGESFRFFYEEKSNKKVKFHLSENKQLLTILIHDDNCDLKFDLKLSFLDNFYLIDVPGKLKLAKDAVLQSIEKASGLAY